MSLSQDRGLRTGRLAGNQVVALNPNFSWAQGNLGSGLACAGNAEEAVRSLKEAVRLSPIDKFSALWISILGFANFLLVRDAEALDLAERSLRERTGFPAPYQCVQHA